MFSRYYNENHAFSTHQTMVIARRTIYDLKAFNLSRLLHKVVLKVDLSSVQRGNLRALLKEQQSFKIDNAPISERIRLLVSLIKLYSMNVNYP